MYAYEFPLSGSDMPLLLIGVVVAFLLFLACRKCAMLLHMQAKSKAGWFLGIAVTSLLIASILGYFGFTAVNAYASASESVEKASGLTSEIDDAAEYLALHEKAKVKTDSDLVKATNELLTVEWYLRPYKELEIEGLRQESLDRTVRLADLRGELLELQGQQLSLQVESKAETSFAERQMILGGVFALLLSILLVLLIFGARRTGATKVVEARETA